MDIQPQENHQFDELATQDRFMIIDGHALIYRAYHAFPGLTDPNGILVNAVYGFSRILLTAIREQEPKFIVLAFDTKEKTNRAKEYEEYKAHRAPMPDDLIPQIAICKKVVEALSIPRFELAGFEADDLIGTLARKISQEKNDNGIMTVIVTGDKDMFQLVNDTVHVWLPGRGSKSVDTEYDAHGVFIKMGVRPNQIVDLKALMGDASDNIPGVKGIGQKTAVKLLQQFDSLEKLYERLDFMQANPEEKDDLLKGSVLQKLLAEKATAFVSQKLATILTAVEVDFDISQCRVNDYDKTKVADLFMELGFKSLITLLPKDLFESGVQDALF